MTSGGNNFNYFPDNPLTKLRYCITAPLSWYYLGKRTEVPQKIFGGTAFPAFPSTTPLQSRSYSDLVTFVWQ